MQGRREDASSRFLLYPTELNYLSEQIARKYKAVSSSEHVNTFHVIKRDRTRYVICPVSKDAQTPTNEINLKFFGDLITGFIDSLTNRNDRDYCLLMPVRLCRGYFKIKPSFPYAQREHLVLVELDLKTMSFKIHDSQSRTLKSIYPDKISEIKSIDGVKVLYDPGVDYHAYNMQDDHFSCGYYVLAYIEDILASGDSAGCAHIKLNIQKDYTDKRDYCNNHGVPEYVAYINGQKVTDLQSAVIEDFDQDFDEMVNQTRSDNVVKKYSPLQSSNLFAASDYVVQLDAAPTMKKLVQS